LGDGVDVLDDNGLHADQVCASEVLLSRAVVVAAAILHPRENNMISIKA
jgi:hypothetical protein